MQLEWLSSSNLPIDENEMQSEAQEMYDRIFHMKFLPPGRGLWAMGSPLTSERNLYAALNNCAFVSTEDLVTDPSAPFCFLMDASMLGIGVGFDTLGAGKAIIASYPHTLSKESYTYPYIIPDSREGWVQSLKALLTAYLLPIPTDLQSDNNNNNTDNELIVNKYINRVPIFDYSLIRPAGVPIKGFGGVSQGPSILKELHQSIESIFKENAGKALTITMIVDIMNLIGKCVVSGNVRRTAEIAFGDPNSDEYITLKDYNMNPQRASYGWTSNNSVFATLGMNYNKTCEKVRLNGEPGFAWLENMQAYGRMSEPKNYKDIRAQGGNPCLEQTLESYELCCLVEIFPLKHDSEADFLRSIELATLYAKTVTLGKTHWSKSNAVMLKNRRFGASLSGLAQFLAARGIGTLKRWCDVGYAKIQEQDEILSNRFAVPRSIKTTCIKPSGTVSLLAGATPGMHYPQSRFYVRRVRLSSNSELIPQLKEAGYHLEPSVTDPLNTTVISIPIDVGEGVRTLGDISMWEQLAFAAFLQAHWADNQVCFLLSSLTILN